MTQLLQKAFERAAKLPQEEQDKFARFLLAELESERQWTELFSRSESEDLLQGLADEALAAHRVGRTQPLDPASQANIGAVNPPNVVSPSTRQAPSALPSTATPIS